MAEVKTYAGSCQCGGVRYEVTTKLENVMECNCSRCGRLGGKLAFAPAPAFKLLAGEDKLTEYRFNTKKVQHLFCATCGIQSFARGIKPDGTPVVAINVRCLEGVDFETLPVQRFDGRSI